jgi:hypothetical protein
MVQEQPEPYSKRLPKHQVIGSAFVLDLLYERNQIQGQPMSNFLGGVPQCG